MTESEADLVQARLDVVRLTQALEKAEAALIACQKGWSEDTDQLEKSEAGAAAMRAIIAPLEWSADGSRCPTCRAYEPASHFANPEYGPWHVGHVEGCALAAALASDAGAALFERLRKAEDERDAALSAIRNWPDPDGLLAARDKLRKLCGEAGELIDYETKQGGRPFSEEREDLAARLKEASR